MDVTRTVVLLEPGVGIEMEWSKAIQSSVCRYKQPCLEKSCMYFSTDASWHREGITRHRKLLYIMCAAILWLELNVCPLLLLFTGILWNSEAESIVHISYGRTKHISLQALSVLAFHSARRAGTGPLLTLSTD